MHQPGLFDPTAAARQRAERGMRDAAIGAEEKSPGWHAQALEAVREFAATHSEPFMAEQVRASMPFKNVDARAFGSVMQDAYRRGWIEKAGYAPANSSNRSPKVQWRSRIWRT